MLEPEIFVKLLCEKHISFFTGVPDSLLKNVCAYISDHIDDKHNIITANEGAAVGLASGYHIATGKIPVVYMQNSGLGNTINPITSLTDQDVYNIPLLLLIGWRGEPGLKDEPQHKKQGKITLPILDTIGVKYAILSKEELEFKNQIELAVDYILTTNQAFAFVVQKDTFSEYKLQKVKNSNFTLSRENAIQIVCDSISEKDVIISTTGMISRELFEYREKKEQVHQKDFLTVGSMGHASQIALGIALEKPKIKVYCFDGDGAVIMHMGSLPIIGSLKPQNYIHIVYNNGAHDSVGGQPTIALNINLIEIAKASGYKHCHSVDNVNDLSDTLNLIKRVKGPIFVEIKVKKGNRKDLGRPSSTPIENKKSLMQFLAEK